VNIFKQAKESKGLSYRDVGLLLGTKHHTPAIWINNPARAGIEGIKRLAAVLGVPEDKAVEFWKECKMEYQKKKYAAIR
jgi:transcriptional regulator with XRE-family HTH domain